MRAYVFPYLLALMLGIFGGCAIGVTNADTEFSDSAARVSDPDEEEPAEGDDEPPIVMDAGPVDAVPSDSGTSSKDAGSAKDAGALDAAMDAAAADASRDSATPSDASGSLDTGAALPDAGAQKDAGSDAGRDAGSDSGSSGGPRCSANTCNNDCSLLGPLRCCRDNDTCGCSWAPGAYCM